ncbi:MAG TPA: hypothetical protein VMF89_28530, partial [Polyangiales bacterium]|nr:hypothetical protein [Polyangiales bacterium]
ALQQAVLSSQRYPSTVLGFIADPRDQTRLRQRVAALRERTLAVLCERMRSAGLPKPKLRARIAFGLVAELTSQTFYEPDYEPMHPELAQLLLQHALTGGLVTLARARPRKAR